MKAKWVVLLFFQCLAYASIEDQSAKMLGSLVKVQMIESVSGICHGVLVDKRKVISAAHCSWFRSGIPTQVWLSGKSALGRFRTVPGAKAPEFDARDVLNDLAVIDLDSDLTSEDGTYLPMDDKPIEVGEELAFAGSQVSQSGFLEGENLVTARVEEFVTPSGRAIVVAEQDGTCKGDSGGPVYRRGNDGELASIVGVVSMNYQELKFPRGCGKKIEVTPIREFVDFIKNSKEREVSRDTPADS